MKAGIEQAIARGLAYAPYCDLIWCETSKPDMNEAKRFAAAIHAQISRQAAGLQLLALLQLGRETQRRRHEKVARGTRGAGLSLPIHHARRLACVESVDVRIGVGLQRRRHARDTRSCSSANSARKRPAIGPPSIRRSSAPAISMRCKPRSAPRAPPSRWRAAPKPSSSTRRCAPKRVVA